jgi:hypothetical protein
MKAYGKVEVQFHIFISSTLDKGKCPTSCIGDFIVGERSSIPVM